MGYNSDLLSQLPLEHILVKGEYLWMVLEAKLVSFKNKLSEQICERHCLTFDEMLISQKKFLSHFFLAIYLVCTTRPNQILTNL